MTVVSLAIGITLWLSFAAYLILPTLDAPPVFARMAIGLCGSEIVMAVAWGIGRDDCADGSCSELMHTAATVAGVQIPALFGAMLLLAAGYAAHVVRSW